MKSRSFCFTLNNYDEDDVSGLRVLLAGHSQYFILGYEEAPTTGTRHIQGYVYFKHPRDCFTFFRKNGYGNVHLEQSRGNASQNRKYCSKSGKYEEYGEFPNAGHRSDIDGVRDMLERGTRIDEIYRKCTSYQSFRFAELYGKYSTQPRRRFRPIVYWYYGPTGTGKTRKATELAGVDTWISNISLGLWFDGYYGQESAIFDDFRAADFKFSHFLRLLDRYPLRVPIKGGFSNWIPTSIFVTTDRAPEQSYSLPSEAISQLIRRIDVIEEF